VSIHYRELNGQVQLRSCRGTGAEAAINGAGGQGKINLIQRQVVAVFLPLLH